MPSLEDRFKAYMKTVPGAESIDDLKLPDGRRKADYLLAERRVILELKALTADTAHKAEAEMERHSGRPEFPVFYGKAPIDKIARHLPDGDAIKQRIYWTITRSVEGAVKSAEEQIADTRLVLGLPDALGLLVLLNESINILDPNVVPYRVAHAMRRKRTGTNDYPTVHYAAMVFESHVVAGAPPGVAAFPCVGIRSKQLPDLRWFDTLYAQLMDGWARFNGTKSAAIAPPPPNTSWFDSKHVFDLPPATITRQELWEMQYEASPYMRSLSDDAVLARGSEIIGKLAPYFLKGGPGLVETEVVPLLQQMAHFQVEARARGLDLRKIPHPDVRR